MKRKRISKFGLIACGVAAAVWILNAALHIYYQSPLLLIVINTICALIWCIAFAVNFYRFRCVDDEE